MADQVLIAITFIFFLLLFTLVGIYSATQKYEVLPGMLAGTLVYLISQLFKSKKPQNS